jgi:hypothetical protein
MANAEQAQRQLPELAALRQCLAALELPPALRQTLDKAFTQSEEQLRQRLEQMAWQAKRYALRMWCAKSSWRTMGASTPRARRARAPRLL